MLPGSQPSLSPGFDSYDFYPQHHRPVTQGHRTALRFSPTAFGDIASTDHLTRRAQHWVNRHRNRDFFLWFHYYDPHVPYEPPAAFSPSGEPDPAIGKRFGKRMDEIRTGAFRPSRRAMDWVRALYHGEVRYVDDRVGRFLSTLKDLGHCCPVKSRIESIGWGHRGIRFGSRMAGVPVKRAFFRIA